MSLKTRLAKLELALNIRSKRFFCATVTDGVYSMEGLTWDSEEAFEKYIEPYHLRDDELLIINIIKG